MSAPGSANRPCEEPPGGARVATPDNSTDTGRSRTHCSRTHHCRTSHRSGRRSSLAPRPGLVDNYSRQRIPDPRCTVVPSLRFRSDSPPRYGRDFLCTGRTPPPHLRARSAAFRKPPPQPTPEPRPEEVALVGQPFPQHACSSRQVSTTNGRRSARTLVGLEHRADGCGQELRRHLPRTARRADRPTAGGRLGLDDARRRWSSSSESTAARGVVERASESHVTWRQTLSRARSAVSSGPSWSRMKRRNRTTTDRCAWSRILTLSRASGPRSLGGLMSSA
jgi:hypothetical protein